MRDFRAYTDWNIKYNIYSVKTQHNCSHSKQLHVSDGTIRHRADTALNYK